MFDSAQSIVYDEMTVEEDTYEKITIIGVGSAGSNIVDDMAGYLTSVIREKMGESNVFRTNYGLKIYDQSYGAIEISFIAINSEKSHLKSKRNIPAASKISIGNSGSGGDIEKVMNWFNMYRKDIESLIDKSTFVIVISGFGGGTGTGVFLPLMDVIDRATRQGPVMPIVIIPAESEGSRRKRAIKYVQEFHKRVNHPIVLVDNDKLFNDPTIQVKKVTEGFRTINSKIVDAISAILMSKLSVGLINIDDADLEKAFCKRESFATLLHWEIGRSYSGYGETDGVSEVVAKLLESPFVDVDVRAATVLYIFFLAYNGVTMGFYTNFQRMISKMFGEHAEIKYDYIDLSNDEMSRIFQDVFMTMARDKIVGVASGIPEDYVAIFDGKRYITEEENEKPKNTTKGGARAERAIVSDLRDIEDVYSIKEI
ncbi:MAG: hypothetical protein J7K58_01040 [Euryarchaeota archaeon]|nr:hypothetical protein [Euryarchaeota archaeon]